MGCRPSKHATSKIRDAHARANHCTCMYSPRKYNKKHKCNSNGTGSRRTSGGTQSGSHGGQSSAGHRSRSHKSDDTDFPAFSTTTAVYRRSASKASKITLRLSSDGSTLEIEQCEYDIAKSKPTVKTISRPWSSAPNLTKVMEKGSPMLKNVDLSLRPSASAWTNVSAFRSTPESDPLPMAWRTALAFRAERGHERRTPNGQMSDIEQKYIRETELINDHSDFKDITRDIFSHDQNLNSNTYTQTFSCYSQDSIKPTRAFSTTDHSTTSPNDHNFQLFAQQFPSTSSQSFSRNPESSLYCLSQFGRPYSETSDTILRHRERCTATLRKPESQRRSGYHYTTDVHRIQSFSKDDESSNDHPYDFQKRNQRASIPRYDCFRIRDYNNIHSQSASSILDRSFQRGDHIGSNQGRDLLGRWQKPNSQRVTPQGENYPWTKKLTNREKLVLNLSTVPSSLGSNSVGFTALVGRRDENWHSNDNLISGQNQKQQPFISILNTPEESDGVLAFVELGCPVSQPVTPFNSEMETLLPVPSFSKPPNSFPDEIYTDGLLSAINKHSVDLNDTPVYDNLSRMSSSEESTTKGASDFDQRFLAANVDRSVIYSSPVPTLITSPRTPVKRKKNINNNNSNRNSTDVTNTTKIEFASDSNTIPTWRESETRLSIVESHPFVLPTENDNSTVPIAFAWQAHTGKDKPKSTCPWKKEGDNLKHQHRPDANPHRWSGKSANEESRSDGNAPSTNMDKNGNANEEIRSLSNDLNRSYDDPDAVFEKGIEDGNLRGRRCDLMRSEEICSHVEEAVLLEGDTMKKDNVYIKNTSDNRHSTQASNRARTQNLPLLCYNNSFGQSFLSLAFNSNHRNLEREKEKEEKRQNEKGEKRENTNSPPASSDLLREDKRHTQEVLNSYQDKINASSSDIAMPPGGENGGNSPSLIQSVHDLHVALAVEQEIDIETDSWKSPAEIKTSIDARYFMSLNQAFSDSRDESDSTPGNSGVTKADVCEKKDTEPGPNLANYQTSRETPTTNTPCSTFQTRLINTTDQNEMQRCHSIKSTSVDDKMAGNVANWNIKIYPFESSRPSTLAPIARRLVPLRILQARIIGRNISDFATWCLNLSQCNGNVMSTRLSPFSTASSNRPSQTSPKQLHESTAKDLTLIDCPNNSGETASQYSELFYDSGKDLRETSKRELHSKYALTNARLTDEMIVRPVSSSHAFQMANTDCVDFSEGYKSEVYSNPTITSCQNTDVPFSPSCSFYSSSSTQVNHPPDNTIKNRPQTMTSASTPSCLLDSASSTTEEEETAGSGLSGSSYLCTIPATASSSIDPFSHVNTPFLSSHSSDSLSCSLSSYSLSHTLHSDTVHTDTSISDTAHSDSYHSDTSHSDTPQFSSYSHVEILQTDKSYSHLNDTTQSASGQSCSFQCLHPQQPNSQYSATLASSTAQSSTSSASPPQSPSTRSSPQSTLSPQSSPSSQCTISPHSSPSSSPSPKPFTNQPTLLHGKTDSLHTQKPYSHLHPNKPGLVASSDDYPLCFSFSPSPPSPPTLLLASPSDPPEPLPLAPLPPTLPPSFDPRATSESGLSILAPSTSCRVTPAENPPSHQKQPFIDPDDGHGLNPNEIQNGRWNSAGDCKGDHPVKRNATISGESWRKLQIGSGQNDHNADNRSFLSDQATALEFACSTPIDEREKADGADKRGEVFKGLGAEDGDDVENDRGVEIKRGDEVSVRNKGRKMGSVALSTSEVEIKTGKESKYETTLYDFEETLQYRENPSIDGEEQNIYNGSLQHWGNKNLGEGGNSDDGIQQKETLDVEDSNIPSHSSPSSCPHSDSLYRCRLDTPAQGESQSNQSDQDIALRGRLLANVPVILPDDVVQVSSRNSTDAIVTGIAPGNVSFPKEDHKCHFDPGSLPLFIATQSLPTFKDDADFEHLPSGDFTNGENFIERSNEISDNCVTPSASVVGLFISEGGKQTRVTGHLCAVDKGDVACERSDTLGSGNINKSACPGHSADNTQRQRDSGGCSKTDMALTMGCHIDVDLQAEKENHHCKNGGRRDRCDESVTQWGNVGEQERCDEIETQWGNVGEQERCDEIETQWGNVGEQERCDEIETQWGNVGEQERCDEIETRDEGSDNGGRQERCENGTLEGSYNIGAEVVKGNEEKTVRKSEEMEKDQRTFKDRIERSGQTEESELGVNRKQTNYNETRFERTEDERKTDIRMDEKNTLEKCDEEVKIEESSEIQKTGEYDIDGDKIERSNDGETGKRTDSYNEIHERQCDEFNPGTITSSQADRHDSLDFVRANETKPWSHESQALKGRNRDEHLTLMSGCPDQINMEPTQRILGLAAERKHGGNDSGGGRAGGELDTGSNGANCCATPNTPPSPYSSLSSSSSSPSSSRSSSLTDDYKQSGTGIDSFSHSVNVNTGQGQTRGKKMGRPLRSVQFLVKHFESVSLRSHAETQSQEKF